MPGMQSKRANQRHKGKADAPPPFHPHPFPLPFAIHVIWLQVLFAACFVHKGQGAPGHPQLMRPPPLPGAHRLQVPMFVAGMQHFETLKVLNLYPKPSTPSA